MRFFNDSLRLNLFLFSPYDILSKLGNLLLFQCTIINLVNLLYFTILQATLSSTPHTHSHPPLSTHPYLHISTPTPHQHPLPRPCLVLATLAHLTRTHVHAHTPARTSTLTHPHSYPHPLHTHPRTSTLTTHNLATSPPLLPRHALLIPLPTNDERYGIIITWFEMRPYTKAIVCGRFIFY